MGGAKAALGIIIVLQGLQRGGKKKGNTFSSFLFNVKETKVFKGGHLVDNLCIIECICLPLFFIYNKNTCQYL